MRFPSVPILKSSLQVILFCWKLPTVTFLCLFVLHERAHSLSPSQVCRFPLLLLNVSYSNGMFSLAWSPMSQEGHTDPKLQATLAPPKSQLQKTGTLYKIPSPQARTRVWVWSLGLRFVLRSAWTPRGPSTGPCVCYLKWQLAEDFWRCGNANPWGACSSQVTFPAELPEPSVDQAMLLLRPKECLVWRVQERALNPK